MIFQVKKFYPYHGFLGVKLKNYEVHQAMTYRTNLVIKKGNEIMTIPYREIKSRIVDKSEPIPSKLYEGTYYSLWGFKWQPDPSKAEKDEQIMRIAMS